MSYCRFSDADVYMFYHVGGFVECCACSLAPLVKTIWTRGRKKGSFFDSCDKCEGHGCEDCWCQTCKGEGCGECMMHGSMSFETFEEAIEHLKEHQKHGHDVPEYAFEGLEEDIKRDGRPKKFEFFDKEEKE